MKPTHYSRKTVSCFANRQSVFYNYVMLTNYMYFFNLIFNPILFVFCMFRTSYIHHHEDYIVHAALYGMFYIYLCKQSIRLKDVLDTVNQFSEYNQQNATFPNLFISVRRSTCFRRFFRPPSGAQNCTYSLARLAAGSSIGLTNT